MRNQISDFVNQRRWAVVGVSNNHTKFGRRIFEDLRRAGYDVVPVHPKLTVLDDGTPVYPHVSAIPVPVDVVDLVVPPAATPDVIHDCVKAGVKRVWFQPGTENGDAYRLCVMHGIEVVADGYCAMVEKKIWG